MNHSWCLIGPFCRMEYILRARARRIAARHPVDSQSIVIECLHVVGRIVRSSVKMSMSCHVCLGLSSACHTALVSFKSLSLSVCSSFEFVCLLVCPLYTCSSVRRSVILLVKVYLKSQHNLKGLALTLVRPIFVEPLKLECT